MATKLFISYRRDNAGIYARLLHQLLKEKKYKVFLDTVGLEQGLFDEQLLCQIERCDYFILLLTDGALNRPFVQREIKHALDHNKKVIPIVDKQFRYPNFLPDPLKRLPSYQSIEADTKDTTQIDFVVQQLENYMREPKSRSLFKYLMISLIPITIVVVLFSLASNNDKGKTSKPNPASLVTDTSEQTYKASGTEAKPQAQINTISNNNAVTIVNNGDNSLIAPVVGGNNISINNQFSDNSIRNSFDNGSIENNSSVTQIQNSVAQASQ